MSSGGARAVIKRRRRIVCARRCEAAMLGRDAGVVVQTPTWQGLYDARRVVRMKERSRVRASDLSQLLAPGTTHPPMEHEPSGTV
eukprot:1500097-Prymnesium_polylepis.1